MNTEPAVRQEARKSRCFTCISADRERTFPPAGLVADFIARLIRILAILLTARGAAVTWPAFGQIGQIYAWTNFVGQPGGHGTVDGTGITARFSTPNSVAVDTDGNVFVADTDNYVIRKVSSAGVVTTLAGSTWISGTNDGTGSAARFDRPSGVATDGAGNLFIADWLNNTIRKMDPAGVVTTLAGSGGTSGTNDGTGSAARFCQPGAVAADANGNVYVADTSNHTIRKVTAAGVVTTLAGRAGSPGTQNGTGSAARFGSPWGVAVDTNGNVFVADYDNHTIRKVTPAGVVTTLAGRAGFPGTNDGTGTAALFDYPDGVATDSAGNVFVADRDNHTIRRVTSAGVVTTLAGSGRISGIADGTGSAARFCQPGGVAVDRAGNVFVADTSNQTIRKVTSARVVTTLAGLAEHQGIADGMGSSALFNRPYGVAVDAAGNVYVSDTSNHTIRKVTPAKWVTTVAGSPGAYGRSDGTGSAALFWMPNGVAVDSAGNLFVADYINSAIRQVTPDGVVTTLAGWGGASGTNDGTGRAARFKYPRGVSVDKFGNLFVADTSNHTIRKVTSAGEVTTLAGSPGIAGTNDGAGGAARFFSPGGLAVDNAGNVIVADTFNQTIRKVTLAGEVTTLAGGMGVSGANDGMGSAARFADPGGVAVDNAGNVFVADTYNNTIRKVTSAGVVTTIGNGGQVMGGADGIGSSANFAYPWNIAVDAAGNLYVADTMNNRISKGTPVYPWLTVGFDRTNLQLAWPTNFLGWELQAQTNFSGAGPGTNWFSLPDSITNTQMLIPIDPASPSVIYRLRHQEPL